MSDAVVASALVDGAFKILQIGSLVGGGLFVLFKLGRAMEKFEQLTSQQSREIGEIKSSITQMHDVITKVATQTVRLDAFTERMNTMDSRLYDLSRGEGFVLPLTNRVVEAGPRNP